MTFDPSSHYQDPSVAEGYDKERFNSFTGKMFDYFEKRAISKALTVVPVGSYVLDVPCGTGRITELILEEGYKAVGMDISSPMIRVAARKLQQFQNSVQFRVGDARNLDLPDNTFDCITCIRLLSHLDVSERIEFLKAFSRVSRKWVIIGISYTNTWYRFRRFLKHLMGSPRPVLYPVSEQNLQKELEESGLKISKRIFPLSLLSEDLILLLIIMKSPSDSN